MVFVHEVLHQGTTTVSALENRRRYTALLVADTSTQSLQDAVACEFPDHTNMLTRVVLTTEEGLPNAVWKA